jgi:hypothetical protein
MKIRVQRLAVVLGQKAHKSRIANLSLRTAGQSGTDSGTVQEVEQDAKHSGVISQIWGGFFKGKLAT